MKNDLQAHDSEPPDSAVLLADLQQIISRGTSQAVASVNSTLTLTYWHVGKRINDEVLEGERATYGQQVIPTLAERLVEHYGKSFEAKNLRRMMQFAALFPDSEIVVPLVRQLSWSHVLILIYPSSKGASAYQPRARPWESYPIHSRVLKERRISSRVDVAAKTSQCSVPSERIRRDLTLPGVSPLAGMRRPVGA